MPQQPRISISIVSHRQGPLVKRLLSDLREHCATSLEVVLTVNVGEILPFDAAEFGFPLKIITNASAKGFAANHNAALRHAKAEYFCVLNPDIRLKQDPFPALFAQLGDPKVGVASPLILNPSGEIENSARQFPTLFTILKKALLRRCEQGHEITGAPLFPDWIAGMFMVFRAGVFKALGGFDERYFLYYEDVDLCMRLRHAGFEVVLLPQVSAIHDARRRSHRDPRYLFIHATSLLRYMYRRQYYKYARDVASS
jgi:GT2 family glycosyltransferase